MSLTEKNRITYYSTCIPLLEESIQHWKKMQAWVRKQDREELVSSVLMKSTLGQLWFNKDCPLCQKFTMCSGHAASTSLCPLAHPYAGCCPEWFQVANAYDWREWLKASKVMVARLETELQWYRRKLRALTT